MDLLSAYAGHAYLANASGIVLAASIGRSTRRGSNNRIPEVQILSGVIKPAVRFKTY
jgi:hypothetical protein